VPARFKVAVTDYTFPDFARYEDELRAVDCELVVPDRAGENFLAVARGAHALLHEHLFLTREVLAALPHCRVIAHHGKGVDNIAVDYASEAGIVVANVLDASLHEVAEHVLALLFDVARRVRAYDRAARAGRWDVRVGEPVYRLHGKTLGLVGFGRIAQCIALKARGLGMRVIAWARRPEPSLADHLDVEYVDLDSVFERADAVSLHLPLTRETERIASARRLRLMKSSAIFINVSRGGLVDEAALHDMLVSGAIYGAGLDVLTEEPASPSQPLLGLDNVVVTPHCAWYSEEGRDDVERRTARAAADVLSGRMPESWVNPEALPRFVERWGPLIAE
jgi:D-3-phosphoglycerate dehydrogenase